MLLARTATCGLFTWPQLLVTWCLASQGLVPREGQAEAMSPSMTSKALVPREGWVEAMSPSMTQSQEPSTVFEADANLSPGEWYTDPTS